MANDTDHIHPDALYSVADVAKLDGCCVASVYNRLSAGEYRAYKDGKSTRIPGSSVLARRATKLRPATFKKPSTIRTPDDRPANFSNRQKWRIEKNRERK